MPQIIPDGPSPNDSIFLGFGAWSGVAANHLDGNDTLVASADRFTVDAGAGNDSISAFDAHAKIFLGTGIDTVRFSDGDMTLSGGANDHIELHRGGFLLHAVGGNDTVRVVDAHATVDIGHGHDSIAASNGQYSIRAGGGHDTTFVQQGEAVLRLGGSHDRIELSSGAYTVLTGAGYDSITGGVGSWLVRGHGHDLADNFRGDGNLAFDHGHDTISAHLFNGTVTGKGGDDLIEVINSTAIVNGNGGHDTITVGGAITLSAGHNDLVRFEDEQGNFNGAHALKMVVANTSGGHDTFEYQYSDGAGTPDLLHGGIAGGTGIGTVIIDNFIKKTEVLLFHDDSGYDKFSAADLENPKAVTVVDHGKHHDIDITIHTTGGATAGTIVLKGVGTQGHHLHSIAALIVAGYHLAFS